MVGAATAPIASAIANESAIARFVWRRYKLPAVATERCKGLAEIEIVIRAFDPPVILLVIATRLVIPTPMDHVFPLLHVHASLFHSSQHAQT
jgi:hypothetical protein